MSASKVKHESNIILNLQSWGISKNKVTKILRHTVLPECKVKGSHIVYFDNRIEVGMYRIDLILDQLKSGNHLKDYGRFSVKIFEKVREGYEEIRIKRDDRFSDCIWLHNNEQHRLTISDLTEIILRCAELDRLKLFN